MAAISTFACQRLTEAIGLQRLAEIDTVIRELTENYETVAGL